MSRIRSVRVAPSGMRNKQHHPSPHGDYIDIEERSSPQVVKENLSAGFVHTGMRKQTHHPSPPDCFKTWTIRVSQDSMSLSLPHNISISKQWYTTHKPPSCQTYSHSEHCAGDQPFSATGTSLQLFSTLPIIATVIGPTTITHDE